MREGLGLESLVSPLLPLVLLLLLLSYYPHRKRGAKPRAQEPFLGFSFVIHISMHDIMKEHEARTHARRTQTSPPGAHLALDMVSTVAPSRPETRSQHSPVGFAWSTHSPGAVMCLEAAVVDKTI